MAVQYAWSGNSVVLTNNTSVPQLVTHVSGPVPTNLPAAGCVVLPGDPKTLLGVSPNPQTCIDCVDQPATQYPHPPIADLRAAPGLEGHGTTTAAGRGGTVYLVSTVAQLEAALTAAGPRIIIFLVGGVYQLTQLITVAAGSLTMYGQTAGAQGVDIRAAVDGNGEAAVRFLGDDLLVQYVRFSAGPDLPGSYCCRDALRGGGSRQVYDHIAGRYGVDETFDLFNGGDDVTISYSMVYHGLFDSTDQTGTAGRGTIIGDGTYPRRYSLHHNLMALTGGRQPLIKSADQMDICNNLLFESTRGIEVLNDLNRQTRVNITDNLFIHSGLFWHDILFGDNSTTPAQVYLSGNQHDTGAGLAPAQVMSAANASVIADPAAHPWTVDTPHDCPTITKVPVSQLEQHLMSTVGPRCPGLDTGDQLILTHLANRTGDLIDCVGGQVPTASNNNCARNVPWPVLGTATRASASAVDGVPAAWKIACGLATTAAEADTINTFGQDSNGDGYRDGEDWVASLC